MEVNILISSVSNKVWLVKAFQEALRLEDDIQGKVISIDQDRLSAGLYESDKHYLVPSSEDPKFILEILEICAKEKISLVIPTRDDELLLFARCGELFKEKGIHTAISPIETIRICQDKYYFSRILKVRGIPIPRTFLPGEIKKIDSIKYPLMVKPREGSSSQGVYRVNNQEELKFFTGYVSKPIIQEFIDGKEYTVDLFSDFKGKIISIVPRERIFTRGGESVKGKTVKDGEATDYALGISRILDFRGAITLQYIRSSEGVKWIEVNPRFGGGCNLSIAAGANSPLFLVQIITGKKISPKIEEFKENLTMLRYSQDFFLE